MQRKKNLVLLVADYPNPNGEPFLEDELKVIAAEFECVYLLQTNTSSNDALNQMFVPLNAKIYSLSKAVKQSFLSKIVFFFTFIFWYQVFLAVFKHRVRFSLSLLKSVNYYLVSSTVNQRLISQFLDQEKIEISSTIFYSYWCDIYTFAIARLKRHFKSMHFVTRVHGWDLYFERHEESFLPFREYIFKQADRIFPVSQDGRKYLLDKRLIRDASKIITSYLGVSSLERNPRYNKASFHKTKAYHLLSLSHINHVKRLDKILDALCLFSNDFHFVWHHIGWGEDEFEQAFKSIVADKLLHSPHLIIKFHGRYTKDAVRDFLQSVPIDFVVNSSDTEGVPVSLMEAAAAGIPAIAFDVGGIPAVLKNGINGILIHTSSQKSTTSLFEAIVQFISFSEEQKNILSDGAYSLWKSSFNQFTNFKKFASILHESDSYVPDFIECSRCLVNNRVHPNAVFNKHGVCDICEIIDAKNNYLKEQINDNYLTKLFNTISKKGKNKRYDCLIGISGGVDSAYLALKIKEQGLRPLLVHVDNGWNSEIAISNIEKLITQLGFDLYTVVIDWEEIKDIVKSFMKASVIDIDWANEMCFVASLYKVAQKFGIKSVLTGHQISSEGWMPETVVHYKLDLINFNAIHRLFGQIPLRTYPKIGYLKSFYYQKIFGIHYYYPLDYLGYDKELAKKELIERYGWRDYGQKHFESIFTRFYQAYLLPQKFGIDKRIFHYSSLVTSDQLSKEQAKKMLEDISYFVSGQFEEDKLYIQKKMGFTENEFDEILILPPKSHFDYPSLLHFTRTINRIKKIIFSIR
jgi:N-acetyl sugar amidotransferase